MSTGPREPTRENAILEAARRFGPAMTELLAELVSIETPSDEPGTIAPAFAVLERELRGTGLTCRRFAGRRTAGTLLARPAQRAGRPIQLLLGHCDTVWPVGTLAQMPAVVEGGTLRGPGSFDMKCGLVQAIYALRILRDLGLQPQVAPVMLVNSDEEIGSFESERIIRRLARIADRALVVEPSLSPGGQLKTRRKGVGQYRLTVTGKAAHAGLNPERGASAILEMALLVQRIFALNDLPRGISVNVGTVEGGVRPNVIAPRSVATIDVRTPTRADAERIDAALRALRPSRPGIELALEESLGRPPLEPSPLGRRLWWAAHELASRLGFALEEGMAGGGSDGNLTNLLTPTLDGLGAVGDGAHAAHEHVDLGRMLERTALLAGLLLLPPVAQLAAGPPGELGAEQ